MLGRGVLKKPLLEPSYIGALAVRFSRTLDKDLEAFTGLSSSLVSFISIF